MPSIYFDASALVKLVLDEDDSDFVADLWNRADTWTSTAIAHVEVRAAIGAAERANRISALRHRRAITVWGSLWDQINKIDVTPVVVDLAGDLAKNHALRALDAIHLASALLLAPEPLIVASWDDRLRSGAELAGLTVVP